MEDNIIKENEIKEHVLEWTKNHLSPDFTFRPHQLENIINIIKNVINNDIRTQCIEAPTGSGKSIIIMVSAGVLSEAPYDRRSYILCSDLFLWKQYHDFIKKQHLPFGYLKGQAGNYICDLNGQDIRCAECRLENISWPTLMHPTKCVAKGYECALHCKYVKDRKKALKTPVTLLTYQLFLYQMFGTDRTKPDSWGPFEPRDVIFCDECHNIPSLVKTRFTWDVSEYSIENLEKIYKYLYDDMELARFIDGDTYEMPEIFKTYPTLEAYHDAIYDIFGHLKDKSYDTHQALSEYYVITEFLMTSPLLDLMGKVSTKKLEKGGKEKVVSKEYADLLKAYMSYDVHIGHVRDFWIAIGETGPEYIVRQIEASRRDDTKTIVTLSCAKEDYISYAYLLNKASDRVLLSATVGNQEAFFENIGTRFLTSEEGDSDPSFERIPSTFDFSRSPIIALSKYKMSKAYKDQNFPKVRDLTYEICRKFKGMRGMIQTGSYKDTMVIYENAPYDIRNRMLIYKDSKDKDMMLDKMKDISDAIIIGPTLNEGIDLPNDLCRFIVITKMPYPSLVDEYVKKKIELFPNWYDSTTSQTLIQCIGRGVRNEKDWCITYILDGCFGYLYSKTKEQYPEELKKRIQWK